jgi:hypothetical protein
MCTLLTPIVAKLARGSTCSLVALLLAATTIFPAWAQSATDSANVQPRPPAEPAQAPYWLRVTAERVNVRSRADLNSRIIGRVNRDDILEGRGSENGWHKIVPPAGVFSLVGAQYIERVGEDRGLVKVDTSLRVRVGSDIQPRDPMLSEVQTRLERGAEVRILGPLDGGWLRIVPPDGVCAYVASDYVEQIAPELAEQLRAAKTSAVTAVSEGPAQPAEPTAQSAEQPDLSGPWGLRLAPVLESVEAEQQKPADEQSWEPLTTQLRPIAEQREEPQVARLAAARLEEVNRRAQQQTVARQAREIARQAEQRQARHERELESIRRAREDRQARPDFDARGVLRPSFAVPAGPYGLRYKLENPFTHQVAAYVEFPTELGVDATACVGKYVGVRGEAQTIKGISVSILRVSHLTVLNPNGPAGAPAREKP